MCVVGAIKDCCYYLDSFKNIDILYYDIQFDGFIRWLINFVSPTKIKFRSSTQS